MEPVNNNMNANDDNHDHTGDINYMPNTVEIAVLATVVVRKISINFGTQSDEQLYQIHITAKR